MRVAFADELRQSSIEIWQKILNHKFIIELSNNTLPVNKFLFYLTQDHYFLEEFAKFLQSAKQKTANENMKKWLDSLYASTINFEMEMQRQMLSSLEELLLSASNSPPLPLPPPHYTSPNIISSSAATTIKHNNIVPCKTTLNYTSYLKDISSRCTFSEIMSVMAPCPWTYLEVAQQLSKCHIQNEVYSHWIQFYSSNESRKQVNEIKEILNLLGQNESEKAKEKMKNHFATACKYEYLFWEMAYNLRG
jgi:thiaminase/transcriptional activator TenA